MRASLASRRVPQPNGTSQPAGPSSDKTRPSWAPSQRARLPAGSHSCTLYPYCRPTGSSIKPPDHPPCRGSVEQHFTPTNHIERGRDEPAAPHFILPTQLQELHCNPFIHIKHSGRTRGIISTESPELGYIVRSMLVPTSSPAPFIVSSVLTDFSLPMAYVVSIHR